MTSLMVSATSCFTSRWSQPLVICKTDSRIFSSFVVVGAEAHEHHLAENAPDQRAAMEQSAGVEFRAEGHQGRLGDHRLV